MDVIAEVLEEFYSREEIYVPSILPVGFITTIRAISLKRPMDVYQYMLNRPLILDFSLTQVVILVMSYVLKEKNRIIFTIQFPKVKNAL